MKMLFISFCLLSSLYSQTKSITLFSGFSSSTENRASFINPDGKLFEVDKQRESFKLNTFFSFNVLTADFNLSHTSSNFDKNLTNFQLREFFFDLSINESTDLFIGRKLFRQGTGYYKNPAGFLNAHKDAGDVNDRLKNSEGRDAIGINTYFENSDLEIVYTPTYSTNKKFKITDHQLTAKYYFLFNNSDFSILYDFSANFKDRLGITFSRTASDFLEIHSEAAFQNGSDNRYHEMTDLSKEYMIFQTSPYNFKMKNETQVHFLGGVNLSLPFGLNIISEYVYDSQGLSRSQWQRLVNYSNWLDGFDETNNLEPAIINNKRWIAQSLNKQREYLFYRLAQPYKDLSISFIGIHNLYDSSAILISGLDYSFKDAYFKLQSSWFLGNSISDWGSLPISNQILLSFILYI